MEILKVSNTNKRVGGINAVGKKGLSSLISRRSKIEVIDTEASLAESYPDNLNFYTTPPSYSISLEEFEQYAVERLKMLRLIERANLTLEETRFSPEYFEKIRSLITKSKNDLMTYYTLLDNSSNSDNESRLQARKIDHISHFLLRLAFARTEDQRKWFMSMEVDFFRLKMFYESSSFDSILRKYKLPFENATEEANEFRMDIFNGTFSSDARSEGVQIYKAHFLHALDLVRTRNVLLKDGYAYIPYNELATVIGLKFRSYLSESLSILKKNIHLIEDDERLRPLVSGFEKRHLGSSASTSTKSGDVVTVAQLETFAQKSFPLCMKHLYDVVQKEHHLKHWGRLQLGLFFKGLGVPIDEATKFWRNNFTKRPEIDSSRFDKQYLYNIRHMYGQEGKRADYTPYSCMKIINSSIGPGDHHGCPFRHSDGTPLRVKLVDAGINQEGIKEIMNLVEQKHFQIACQRYFEYTHDQHTVDGGVNHPNQYFMESRNVLTGKKTVKSESKVETTRTLYYKNGSTQSQADLQSSLSIDNGDVPPAASEVVDMNVDDGNDSIFESLEY